MFEKLPVKALKELIRMYNLHAKISLSKMVDGKRRSKTKRELSDEVHKHLEIRSDGEIIHKQNLPTEIKDVLDYKKPARVKKTIPQPVVEMPQKRKLVLKQKQKTPVKDEIDLKDEMYEIIDNYMKEYGTAETFYNKPKRNNLILELVDEIKKWENETGLTLKKRPKDENPNEHIWYNQKEGIPAEKKPYIRQF